MTRSHLIQLVIIYMTSLMSHYNHTSIQAHMISIRKSNSVYIVLVELNILGGLENLHSTTPIKHWILLIIIREIRKSNLNALSPLDASNCIHYFTRIPNSCIHQTRDILILNNCNRIWEKGALALQNTLSVMGLEESMNCISKHTFFFYYTHNKNVQSLVLLLTKLWVYIHTFFPPKCACWKQHGRTSFDLNCYKCA